MPNYEFDTTPDLEINIAIHLANVRYYAERKQARNTYRETITTCKCLSEYCKYQLSIGKTLDYIIERLTNKTKYLIQILNDYNMYDTVKKYYEINRG